MTSTPITIASSASRSPAAPAAPGAPWLALGAALVLAGFGAFSIWVAATHGVVGFLALAGREPWALQMLVDLAIACGFGLAWMLPDARRRGITAWPFVAATVALGSLGLLAYALRAGAVAYVARARP